MRAIAAISMLVAALLLAMSCASTTAADTAVTFLKVSEIAENPSVLPSEGLVNTGQPNAAVLDAAAEAGFSAVIDFRGPDEDRGLDEVAEVEKRGMRYIAIPVTGKGGVSFENAAKLDDALSDLKGPVLLHCKSGNRAAAILALREKQNGADNEAALAVGVDAGLTGLRGVVEARLAGD